MCKKDLRIVRIQFCHQEDTVILIKVTMMIEKKAAIWWLKKETKVVLKGKKQTNVPSLQSTQFNLSWEIVYYLVG